MSVDTKKGVVDGLMAHFDHHSPEFQATRQDFYGAMHAKAPVLHSDRYGGFWFVGDYDAVVDVQARQEDFSNIHPSIPEAPFPMIIPARIDPPMHRKYRMLLMPFFTPSVVAEWQPRIEQISAELLDTAIARGKFDMITEVMQPFVAMFVADFLGLDPQAARSYAPPLHHASLPHYPRDKSHDEMQWLLKEIAKDVRNLLANPKGVLGRLGQAEFDGRRLTIEELEMIAVNLLIGGLGTTPMMMGSITVFLTQNPEHRRRLIQNPALVDDAFDELLRVFSPTQTFGRQAKHDTTVAGQPIAKGEMLLLGYGAANHDPDQFPDPTRIDFDRKPVRHTAFGIGPHRCLGASIAKMIITYVTRRLLSLAPNYRLSASGPVPYVDVATKLGYSSVPVEI